jgi:hypothetical protein
MKVIIKMTFPWCRITDGHGTASIEGGRILSCGLPRSPRKTASCVRSQRGSHEAIEPRGVNGVDERAGFRASLDDTGKVVEEPLCHLGSGKVPTRETEASDPELDDGSFLRFVVANAAVLHEDHLAALTRVAEPLGVPDLLVGGMP